MQERATMALVLEVEQVGEADGRVVLYTESDGKVIARAKSLFKPRSKLAGHLQPLTLAEVRLVEKKGVQVVDAIAKKRLSSTAESLGLLSLISELSALHHPDRALWKIISEGNLVSRELLTVLGFNPLNASCDHCLKKSPTHFLLREAVYLCARCFGLARTSAGIVV